MQSMLFRVDSKCKACFSLPKENSQKRESKKRESKKSQKQSGATWKDPTVYAVSFIAFLHDLLHPLHGDGYQFYSGIAGSFLMPTGMWTAVLFLAHHHRKHHRELIEALAARMPEGREG